MALRPFEFFRKRQKLMLAALTLIAMFLFIVGDALGVRSGQGGGGDAGTIKKWFTSKEAVATVGGRELDARDLNELAMQRVAVLQLVDYVWNAGRANFNRSLGLTPADATNRE